MRRAIGLYTAASILAVLVYAPLFHVHTDTGGAALFHAHLPEAEDAEAESVVHMESEHSHSEARPTDLFTATTAHQFEFSPVILTVLVQPNPLGASCGFAPVA